MSVNDSSGLRFDYTYTGDVITKIERYFFGKLTRTIDYTYANGKLATYLYNQADRFVTTSTYIYNDDGTVSSAAPYAPTEKYTYLNGNLTKNEYESYAGGYHYTYINEYDTRFNPSKNILGFNLLLDQGGALTSQGGVLTSSKNNVTKWTELSFSARYSSTIVYTYKAKNFPVKAMANEGYHLLAGNGDTITTTIYIY